MSEEDESLYINRYSNLNIYLLPISYFHPTHVLVISWFAFTLSQGHLYKQVSVLYKNLRHQINTYDLLREIWMLVFHDFHGIV